MVKDQPRGADGSGVLLRSSTKAGHSADAYFRQARDAWRRRVVRRIQPFLLVPATLIFIAQVAWGQHNLSWTLGLAAGGLIAVWVWVRDSPPPHIENWRTGAEGERKTARALKPLERQGWSIVHDVASQRGNRDHVLVGPAGVFLLDTKYLSGVVSIEEETVRLARPDNPRATCDLPHLARSLRGAAASLSEELGRRKGRGVWVNAVVVLWAEFPARVVETGQVAFVAGEHVATWLADRPQRLSPERLDELSTAVVDLPRA